MPLVPAVEDEQADEHRSGTVSLGDAGFNHAQVARPRWRTQIEVVVCLANPARLRD